MLTITQKNGNTVTYSENSYTEYMWKHNAFVVLKGDQWIGIYNWDCVESVEFTIGK